MVENPNTNDRLNHLEESKKNHEATHERHEKEIESVRRQSSDALQIAQEAKKCAAVVKNDHHHFESAVKELKEIAKQHCLALNKIAHLKWAVYGGFTVATTIAAAAASLGWTIKELLIEILKLAE